MNLRRHLFLALTSLLVSTAAAAPPGLDHLLPSGARAGETVEVAAIGAKDPWPPQAWSSSSLIAVEPQKDKGKLKVRVAAEAAAGVYWIRLYNDEGVSAVRPFVVGTLPEVEEKEPNDRLTEAQEIAESSTINGRLEKSRDTDAYAVKLDKDETLVASVDASRHLVSPLDAILQVVSPRGIVLEQNDDYHASDPQVVFTAPQAGTYLVRIFGLPLQPNSSIQFAGGATYIYRLTLTTEAFVDHLFPLALPRREPGAIELSGWNIPDELKSFVLLPAVASDQILVRHSGLGNTFPLRLVSRTVQLESEPNSAAEPQTVELPTSLSGRIDPPGDVDLYRFTTKKDARFRFEIEARQLGSPIDPALRILDAGGKQLAESDDAGGNKDPRLDFTAPADGEFRLEVRDVFQHGGPRYVYGLHATIPAPQYALTLGAGQFVLTPGKELEIPVTVNRQDGYNREIEIAAVGLPGSVKAVPGRSAPTGDTAKTVKIKLTTDQGPFSGTVRIVGKEVGPASTLQTATFATGGENQPSDLVWLTILVPEEKDAKKEEEKKEEEKKEEDKN